MCGRNQKHESPPRSSSAAADMEKQLPATDKRVVGTVEDSEMEYVHSESKRAKTIGGMEVCVLDDYCDEWFDEPGQLLEEGDEDRRNVPEHIHRMPFCLPAEEGLNSETNFSPRDVENLCATVL